MDDQAVAVRSVASYTLGGREYPLYTSPRCGICNSPDRFEVERLVVLSRSVNSIVAALPENSPLRETYANAEQISAAIRKHRNNGHMPADAIAQQSIIDAELNRLGVNEETMQGTLVTWRAFNNDVMRRAWEAMAEGKSRPSISQGLRAAEALAAIESQNEALDSDTAAAAIFATGRIVAQFVTPEQLQQIQALMAQDPALLSLMTPGMQAGTASPQALSEHAGADSQP